MTEHGLPCHLHGDLLQSDKRIVRNHLQGLTEDQTAILLADSKDPPLDYEPVIGEYSTYREYNAKRYEEVQHSLDAFRELDGHLTNYVTTTSSPSRYTNPILSRPFVPIGEYGTEPARRLLHGVLGMLAVHEQKHEAIVSLASSTKERSAAVRFHTFQGNINQDSERGFGILTQIGIVSIGQALATLTIERVHNTSWSDLAQEVVDEELLTEFVRRIGMGLLPQMIVYGRYKRQPVFRIGDCLLLSPGIKAVTQINRRQVRRTAAEAEERASLLDQEFAKASQSGIREDILQILLALDINHVILSSGTTCPAANQDGEITQIARRILEMAAIAPD